MRLTVPEKRPAMYCSTVPAGFFLPGWGPSGLGFEVNPFPFATSKRFPSGVTRTVGWIPARGNKSDRPASARLANIKNSEIIIAGIGHKEGLFVRRQRETVWGRARGELGTGKGGVSRVVPRSVSKTETVFRLALATYRRLKEHDGAVNRVAVLVSPRVGLVNEESVVKTVLAFLGSEDQSSRMMSSLWEQGRTVRVLRREPYVTPAAKTPPIRVVRRLE